MKDSELVTFEKGEARTTSLVLADGTELEHASVIKMVRKYADDLEEFGTLRFEIAKSGGLPTEYALLNEQQATLIMTYMKNTPVVREFKKALVRAFFALRDMVANNPDKRVDVNMSHTRGITNIHGLDIRYNLDLTKICQRPTKHGLQILERLTGLSMADILPEDECHPETPAVTRLFVVWEEHHLAPLAGSCTSATAIYNDFKEYYTTETGLPAPSQKWFGGEMSRRNYRKKKKGTGHVEYLGVTLANAGG